MDIQRRAQAKLMMLNNARELNDLRVPPGNRLEALSGDRKGTTQQFVSTNSGGSAFSGGTEMPTASRSWTTTEDEDNGRVEYATMQETAPHPPGGRS